MEPDHIIAATGLCGCGMALWAYFMASDAGEAFASLWTYIIIFLLGMACGYFVHVQGYL